MKRTSPPNFGASTPDRGTGKPGAAAKAAPARGRSKPDWLDCLDRIHGPADSSKCWASLMESQVTSLWTPKPLREAGSLLEEQMEQLRAALADLEAAR